MTKMKTVTATVSIGKQSKTVELEKQAVLNNPAPAIGAISGLVQDVVLEFNDAERAAGHDDPMEGYEPKIGHNSGTDRPPANSTADIG